MILTATRFAILPSARRNAYQTPFWSGAPLRTNDVMLSAAGLSAAPTNLNEGVRQTISTCAASGNARKRKRAQSSFTGPFTIRPERAPNPSR